MSIEGLWFLQLASVKDPAEFQHGGIVVLEAERVLGADSIHSYLGDYHVQNDELIARIRIRTWNKDVPSENVFGLKGPIDQQVEVHGKHQDGLIHGSLGTVEAPGLKLPMRMRLIANLP